MVTQTQQPNLVRALTESARSTLETMVFLTPSFVEQNDAEERSFSDGVIGLLSFTGTESGTLFVRTSLATANHMAAKMLMLEDDEIGDFAETADAFGEIVNMMAGNFKNDWVALGNKMDLAIPHVVQSDNMHINTSSLTGPRISVHVDIDGNYVDLDLFFQAQG